jgi:flagellar basal body P-ring protein FlgI
LLGDAAAPGHAGGRPGSLASRIKDLAYLEGTTPEPLLGYGLVIGLNGTGDGQSNDFTITSLSAMLERLGVTVDPAVIRLKNVAAVVVTAEIDPTAGSGRGSTWSSPASATPRASRAAP